MIFLSDGECHIADQTMQDLCRSAVRLGSVAGFLVGLSISDTISSKALSFHSVSFGPDGSSSSLRRMTQIALDVQNNAPRDPLAPPAATVASSYTQALDTVSCCKDTYYVHLTEIRLGTTRRNVPGNRRIAQKAERFSYPLKET
jgi:hypothetical protein